MSAAARIRQDAMSDAEIVEAYLTASMIPDPDKAATFMAPGTIITFTGGREFDHPSGPTSVNAARYRWVKKRMDRFDVCPGDAETVVYCIGTLYGEWPDGTPFEGNRYVDRFVVKDGRIVKMDVWNDSAEKTPYARRRGLIGNDVGLGPAAMKTVVFCDRLLDADGRTILRDRSLRIVDGRIAAIEPGVPGADGRRTFVLPAFANAHDHARPTASRFGVTNLPLEAWILRTVVARPPDPYLVAADAFARWARAGCATAMVHYTLPSGTMPIVEEAKAFARAAADVGIRIAFALAIRDQNMVGYGDRETLAGALSPAAATILREFFEKPPLAPKAYVETVDAIADAIGGPMVDVQYGPAGVQWCSRPLLEAIAEASRRTSRRVHMHLLETVYQRAWADEHFPGGMVAYLRDIGLLSDRLTLAHCVYARPDELEMIAASGTRIVTNFTSNLSIRSGFAPIAAAYRCGCAIAVGVDGLALDEDDDALREMRLVQMTHGGTGFAATWTPQSFFREVVANGRAATGAPGDGALRIGAPADFVVVDLDRLERDAIVDADPLDRLFARGNSSMIRGVFVAGRKIVSDGVVTGIDTVAVAAQASELYRRQLASFGPFLEAWPGIRDGLQTSYAALPACG